MIAFIWSSISALFHYLKIIIIIIYHNFLLSADFIVDFIGLTLSLPWETIRRIMQYTVANHQ